MYMRPDRGLVVVRHEQRKVLLRALQQKDQELETILTE